MTWDFIGNQWAVEFLEQSAAAGTTHQAYLFCGPDGVGKRTLALRFGQRLLCQLPAEGPCRQCRACRQLEQLHHPDMHLLEAEEVDGTLKVEVIREMQRQIALAPYQADKRIVLILRAHELSQSAANALLKTLEEPPSQVVILLTARSEQALLPTLVSRCELLALRPVAQAELVRGLRQTMEAEQAELLASLAAGLPGAALRLAADEEALTARKEALDSLSRILHADRIERFQFAKEIADGRELAEIRRRILDLLDVWLSLWRDVMLRRFGAEVALANPDESQRIDRIAAGVTADESAIAVKKIEAIMTGITLNANPQLSMESLMLSLPYL